MRSLKQLNLRLQLFSNYRITRSWLSDINYTTAIITLFLFLAFLYCDHILSPCDKEKFFHPNNLSKLHLDHIDNFWEDDTVCNISDYTLMQDYPGFLRHIRYSKKSKIVAVTVFISKDMAIDAMEERIEEVSMKIFHGNAHDKIKDKWWWGIYLNFQRAVFINKWNTIVEAACLDYDYADDDSIRVLLEDTALEITRRVDALSE